jgi:hypothetical protein
MTKRELCNLWDKATGSAPNVNVEQDVGQFLSPQTARKELGKMLAGQ